MVKEIRNGQMGLIIVENGQKIKLMAWDRSYMPMVIFMMDNGNSIKHMAVELIHMLMEQNTKVNDEKIDNMEWVWKLGPTVLDMKENIN